jgi:hypothetical protein
MSNAPFNMNNPNDLNVPPTKSKLPLILGIVFVLLLLCCGGGIAVVYFGLSYGSKEVAKMSINQSPQAREAIGDVQSASMDMSSMGSNPGKMVLDVKGSKGSGKLFMKQDPGQQPVPLELKMSDGTVIQFGPEPELDAPQIELPKLNSGTAEPATP